MSIVKAQQVNWDDLAVRLGLAILRKAHGYHATDTEKDYRFDGLTEADCVLLCSRIIEASGYDVYLENSYPDTKARCDIYGQTWRYSDEVWCEVKQMTDTWDARLNRKRFYEREELIGDVDRLRSLAPAINDRAHVVVAYSETGEIVTASDEEKTLRLGNVVEEVSGRARCEPRWFTHDVSTLATTEDYCRHLHVLVWSLEREA